jgi:CheY-like chemotaxis protein
VVEDDGPIREVVVTVLADAGYLVTSAPDGVQALVRCREVQPDLVLLDLSMPVMDGFEFLRTRECRAPVVVMSAAYHRARLDPGAGVRDFIEKPFDVQSLVMRVGEALRT